MYNFWIILQIFIDVSSYQIWIIFKSSLIISIFNKKLRVQVWNDILSNMVVVSSNSW